MPLPNPKTIYNFLTQHQHRVNETYANELPLFKDTIAYDNDAEYWWFSDLYNLFGNEYTGGHNHILDTMNAAIQTADFEKLPKKNADKVNRAPDFHTFYSDHVISTTNNYKIINPYTRTRTAKNGNDAKLSRYACWSLVKLWPNMIFAQLYFMKPDAKFEDLYNAAYKFSRIYHRYKLTQAEKIVNGIAHKHKTDMQLFNAFMHRKFFYNTDINAIKSAYKIKGTIFDYMGTRSLMARYNALFNAIDSYNLTGNMSFDRFIEKIYNELIAARMKMIARLGRVPESDLSRTPITKVANELKKMESDFMKKYAYQKLR